MSGPQLPWPADRRPLSVVTLANSAGSLQMPFRTDRGDGTYTEVLADLLTGHGVPTIPHQESRWFEFLHRAMRDYERRVRAHTPDVLIVQFGFNECQPWLLPVWVVRHLMVQNQAVTRSAKAYRRWVAPRLWLAVRGYRRRTARLADQRTWQTTPHRFAGHLRRLINNVRIESRPLVLVVDIDVPNARLEHFLPGAAGRHARYQQLLADVVAEFDDPEVRLFKISEITAPLGAEGMPDGMHYTPAVHRTIGEALTAEILDWLRGRATG